MLKFIIPSIVAAKDGISFVVIGDFANIGNMKNANRVFDSINQMRANASSDSAENFDFFVTVGDNVYVQNQFNPTDQEFQTMMDLFLTRESIKDLPIYPVRGNHDCMFRDMQAEVNLSKKYPTWKMDNLYYSKTFEIGKNGEKFALLAVDSCLLLCDTLLNKGTQNLKKLDDETQAVFMSWCDGHGPYEEEGRKMMVWLNSTLNEQSADPSIVWKASTQHYPLFGMHYDDTEDIITTLMPLLKEHEYDVYFNGHEHQMNYAHAPDKIFEETKIETEAIAWYEKLANLVINHQKKSCFANFEYFGKFPEVRDEPRTVIFEKGDKLHQLTIGASGRGLYNICPKHMSQGNFEYSQNKHFGYSLVHVTADKFRMEIRGIP